MKLSPHLNQGFTGSKLKQQTIQTEGFKMKKLLQQLRQLEGKGYKGYKNIQGHYTFNDFNLAIDYVQGDPFASPSKIRIVIPHHKRKIDEANLEGFQVRFIYFTFMMRNYDANFRRRSKWIPLYIIDR